MDGLHQRSACVLFVPAALKFVLFLAPSCGGTNIPSLALTDVRVDRWLGSLLAGSLQRHELEPVWQGSGLVPARCRGSTCPVGTRRQETACGERRLLPRQWVCLLLHLNPGSASFAKFLIGRRPPSGQRCTFISCRTFSTLQVRRTTWGPGQHSRC